MVICLPKKLRDEKQSDIFQSELFPLIIKHKHIHIQIPLPILEHVKKNNDLGGRWFEFKPQFATS